MKLSISKSALVILATVGVVGVFGLGIRIGQNMELGATAKNTIQGLQSSSEGGLNLAPMQKVLDTLNNNSLQRLLPRLSRATRKKCGVQ